jgi:hypothetical protein
LPKVQSASIYNEYLGSDHCPVGLEVSIWEISWQIVNLFY